MEINEEGQPQPFPGFRGPHYTQVPDELFDELLPQLSGSELKVLLYIMRRTFGFKRNSDTISISQMLNGIVKRDGTRLDHGAGVSKKPLLKALKSLRARQIIFAQRQHSEERGNQPTLYQLNVVTDQPLGGEAPPRVGADLPQGVGDETPPSPRGRNSPTQDTDLQNTVKQETEYTNSNLRTPSATKTEPGKHAIAGQTDNLPDSIGTILASRPPTRDPNPSGAREEVLDEDYQRIQDYVEDRAREFNDRAPLKSSTTRAWRMYKRSGVSIEEFTNRIYQARSITRERTAAITKTATDPRYGRQKTKMAYFFAVLEDHLGLAEQKDKATRARTDAPEEKTEDDYSWAIQR